MILKTRDQTNHIHSLLDANTLGEQFMLVTIMLFRMYETLRPQKVSGFFFCFSRYEALHHVGVDAKRSFEKLRSQTGVWERDQPLTTNYSAIGANHVHRPYYHLRHHVT